MKYQYTINDKECAYDGFFKFDRYSVSFEKFNGGFYTDVMRECSKKGDVVSVLPYDPIRKVFLMVEQFRIGMAARKEHPWTVEIVAGFMDIEGESPEQTAKRELEEETGCQAITISPLIEYYPGPGGSAAKNHVFVATIDSTTAHTYTGISEEAEDIRVHQIPLEDMQQRLNNNEIHTSTAIIALQEFFAKDWLTKL
ncbi:MAG: NUDIX domain-containing protein [Gammaproteobacteria bacterium]|nr:NUDIX domain-containing protein [Gammaproteobacteria bacterium]